MTFTGHIPRKRFGQHWLKDESVLERIISAADLKSNDRVLEIGPGRGMLTAKLLKSKVGLVHAVELDRDLVVGLRQRFCDQARFSLQEGDALTVSISPPDKVFLNKVVANIPYNITAPLLERLLGGLGRPMKKTYELLVLLLQKEVAERILSKPGQSNFSAMSVRIQLLANCRNICVVPPSSFIPPPKVYSQVVLFEPLKSENRLDEKIEVKVDALLKTAFQARRKKLRNTLGAVYPVGELEPFANSSGISLDQRPQELSPLDWVTLASHLL